MGLHRLNTQTHFGGDMSWPIYTCDFPRVPPYGSSVRLKKTDKGRGVSIYVTTGRPRGDHGATRGRPRGDQGWPALVLLSVFFPAFGLLLYYNTQAAHAYTHAYTHANTRPPRVHSRAQAHVRAQAHPRARTHTHTRTHVHTHASTRTHGGRRTRRSHRVRTN